MANRKSAAIAKAKPRRTSARRTNSSRKAKDANLNQEWCIAVGEMLGEFDNYDGAEPQTPEEAAELFLKLFEEHKEQERVHADKRVVEAERDILLRALTERQ